MQVNDRTERALRMLGLAVRAGRAVVGVPLICEALKKGSAEKSPRLLLLASDASANSEKRVRDRAAFYGIPCHALCADSGRLALAVGKREAAVVAAAVTDEGLAQAILHILTEEDNR